MSEREKEGRTGSRQMKKPLYNPAESRTRYRGLGEH
jgi:hypothetical protein